MSPHPDVAQWCEPSEVCWPSSVAFYPAGCLDLCVGLVQGRLMAERREAR